MQRTRFARPAMALVTVLMLSAGIADAQTKIKPGFNLFSPQDDVQIGQHLVKLVKRLIGQMPELGIGVIEGLVFKGKCYSALAQMLGTRSVTERLSLLLNSLTLQPLIRLLKIRGFGRIDVRLTATGEVFVIEANPNPSLAADEDFAQSAATAGVGYDALIQEILDASQM